MAFTPFQTLADLTAQQSTLTPAQRWILATNAILRERNDNHHDLLAGNGRGASCGAVILHDGWGIQRRSELYRTIDNLLAPRSPDAQREYPAWDWLRASCLATWGYDAWMQSDTEAWAQMRWVAQLIQQNYRSFREVGDHYLAGFIAQNTEGQMGPSEENQAAIEALLAPGGVWNELEWDTPLADTPVPQDPSELFFARPGEPISAVLERALARGIDPKRTLVRIELEPGTYPTDVNWVGALEIVATGEGVILQGPPDRPAFLLNDVNSGLRVEGAVIRAGENANVAAVEEGLMRLERCVLQGDVDGFQVDNENAAAQLVDCKLEGFEIGIYAFGGHTEIVNTRFDRTSMIGVKVFADGSAFLFGCGFFALTGKAMKVLGKAHAVSTRFERVKKEAIQTKEGGSLMLESCEFFDCHALSLHVEPGSKSVVVYDSSFRRSGTYAVQLQSPGIFVRCRFEDSRSLEAMVHGCGAQFVECTFQGSGLACVYVSGANEPPDWERAVHLDRCLIRDSRAGGILLVENGAAVLSQVEIVDCQVHPVEVRSGSQVSARDCTWQGKGSGALLVHEKASVLLKDCRLSATLEHVVCLLSGGRLKLEGCHIQGAPHGLTIHDESVVDALDTVIENSTEVAGVLVAESSRARFRKGKIQGHQNLSVLLKEGSQAVFSDVTIQGPDVYVIDAQARFDRCETGQSDETAFMVEGGYLAVEGGVVAFAKLSAVEVRNGTKARFVDASIRSFGGEAALFVHDDADVWLVGCDLHGGTEATVDVSRNSTVRRFDTAIFPASGFDSDDAKAPPLVLRGEGGTFLQLEEPQEMEFKTEPEWISLAQMLEEELIALAPPDDEAEDAAIDD